MATLYLMCGLPCAGKTTLAKRLEQDYAALRLTPDEWHTRLFGQDVEEPQHEARHHLLEAMLWEVAARVLSLDVNVILDFGFWSRSERDDYRSRAAELGASSEVLFLDVPDDVLLERLRARNAQRPPKAFSITEEQLDAWIQVFEAPVQDELGRWDIGHSSDETLGGRA